MKRKGTGMVKKARECLFFYCNTLLRTAKKCVFYLDLLAGKT